MRRYAVPIILALALIVTGAWGYNQYSYARSTYTQLDNQHQRMFYDLIAHVENVELNLAKAMITSTPNQSLVIFSNTWNHAYMAQEKMSQLPITHSTIRNTEKFLSQVGDYCYSIMRKNVDGAPISQEDFDNIAEIHNYAGYIGQELQKLRAAVDDGTVTFSRIRRIGKNNLREMNENMIDLGFNRIQERLVDYPELIYDGPFSEDVLRVSPRGLTGPEVTAEQAARIVENFVGKNKVTEVRNTGKGEGDIRTHSFEATQPNHPNNPIYIDVSRKGGHVVWMLNHRPVGRATLSQSQAVDVANKFLINNGLKSMVPTYSLRYDDVAVINYAYYQDGVVVYPDLIKIKVALDNGDIVGYEAASFLTSHTKRTFDKPQISVEEAREKLSVRLDVQSSRLALIPLESRREVLCYEFKGTYQNDQFLIYINAETGRQERILKVITTEKGTLTI